MLFSNMIILIIITKFQNILIRLQNLIPGPFHFEIWAAQVATKKKHTYTYMQV